MNDFQNILEKGMESLSDIFKMKYAAKYAEEIQPTVVQTYQKVAIPTLIIVIGGIILFYYLWK